MTEFTFENYFATLTNKMTEMFQGMFDTIINLTSSKFYVVKPQRIGF